MKLDAASRCAVVTAGTDAIGATIAEGFAVAGLRVLIIGHSSASGLAVEACPVTDRAFLWTRSNPSATNPLLVSVDRYPR